MRARGSVFELIAVVVSVVALAPMRGEALQADEGLDPLPVQGVVLPEGDFVGTLRIVACTLDAAGQLRLTGVLNGAAAHRTRGRMPVIQQPFTAPATLRDPGHTTDVVRLAHHVSRRDRHPSRALSHAPWHDRPDLGFRQVGRMGES